MRPWILFFLFVISDFFFFFFWVAGCSQGEKHFINCQAVKDKRKRWNISAASSLDHRRSYAPVPPPPPPPPARFCSSQVFDLASMLYSVDWWNARWLESDSSFQVNVYRLILISRHQATCSVTLFCCCCCWRFYSESNSLSLRYCSLACGSNTVVTLRFFRAGEYYLWCSVWVKLLCWLAAGNPLSIFFFFLRSGILFVAFWLAESALLIGNQESSINAFSRAILFVTFWLAEAALLIGNPESSINASSRGILFLVC